MMSRYATPVTVLLVLWGLLLIRQNTPWWGYGDENGAWISAVVRNYQLYGAGELKFLQITNFGPASPETYNIYNHHPPLVSWTAALGAALFGFREASLRLLTGCITLIGAAAFYVLSRRVVGQKQAVWALIFYSFTPMMIYYGRMPDHEALSLLFSILFLAVFVNWMREPSQRRWGLLAVLACLAGWSAWGAVFFVGSVLLVGLWKGSKQQRRHIVVLGVVTILSILALLAYYQLAWSGTLSDLAEAFFSRTGDQSGSIGSRSFTLGEYIFKQFVHVTTLMTPSLLILTVIGLMLVFGQRKTFARSVVVIILGAAAAYLVVFRSAGYIHDYYKIYFAPGMALTASFAASWLNSKSRADFGRFSRPALAGLLLAMVISGAYFLNLLYRSADQPDLDILTHEIATRTQPTDRILVSMDYGIPSVSFYTFREIERNIEPKTALIRSGQGRLLYVYCDENGKVSVPPELSGFESDRREGCSYFWLGKVS